MLNLREPAVLGLSRYWPEAMSFWSTNNSLRIAAKVALWISETGRLSANRLM